MSMVDDQDRSFETRKSGHIVSRMIKIHTRAACAHTHMPH